MTTVLDKLLDLFCKDRVFLMDSFNNINVNDFLDERDEDPFDGDWVNAFNEVKKQFETLHPERSAIDKIDKIRELAFRSAFSGSNSSDLAGYVSDDFELISKAIVINSDNKWVTTLLDIYLGGGFPSGKLVRHSVKVRDLV